MHKKNIAVVILNYNSENDLFKCMEDIQEQKKINLIVIVVDNASNSESVDRIKVWNDENYPDSISGTPKEVMDSVRLNQTSANTFFLYNNENKGYSAGNNIGIKLADIFNVDAVLIVNPDMQFPDKNYISTLYQALFSKNKHVISASRIIGLDDKDQSPLREATFWEEFFWPRQLFPKIFKNTSYISTYVPNKIIYVPKVIGCCLLIKTSFLRDINYFDESVFLYTEESILAKQVQKKNKQIIFLPTITAIHAHIRSQKENNSLRMQVMIKSRKYYLSKYSNYNILKRVLLDISYNFLSTLYKIKYLLQVKS